MNSASAAEGKRPQGLKADFFAAPIGAAEAAPFQIGYGNSPDAIATNHDPFATSGGAV
jgi:hypothetical protein